MNNIKIAHKLKGSYAAIIILVSVLVIFSFFNMSRLQNLFSDYRSVAQSSLLMADMTTYLGEARLAVFKYRVQANEEAQAIVEKDVDKLIKKYELVDEIVKDTNQKQALFSIRDKIQTYDQSFNQVVNFQKERDALVDVLNDVGPGTRKKLSDVMRGAYQSSNADLVYYSGFVQEKLMLARFYANSFLLVNDTKSSDRALKEINLAISNMAGLEAAASGTRYARNTRDIKMGLQTYKTNFENVFETIQSRNENYAVMDDIGPRAMGIYNDQFNENENRQRALGPIAAQKIKNVSNTTTAIGLIIALLSIIVAIVMSKLIVGALSSVTSVMSRLTDGDFTVEIKGTDRGDEIGLMSRAIAQFKDDAEKSFLLKQMVDDMPTNVMTVDVKDDLKVNYINNTSIKTLSKLEDYLPVKSDNLLGQAIDIFHSDPDHQKSILADPSNLPHTEKTTIGPETITLMMSSIHNKQDEYIGAMLTWEIITAKEAMGQNVGNVVNVVGSAVTELEATSQSMSSMAEETQAQATAVAAAAEEASANVSTVAASTEELTASIAEISAQIQESTNLTSTVRDKADTTNKTVGSLKEAADNIGAVVSLINDIAEQTNLLALNATIEAARAGDAGKGFAVVASEVKNLASETAKATEDIAKQIANIQEVTGNAVVSTEDISNTISQLDQLSSTIAAAIEEQTSATKEIARSVEQAAIGTTEVTTNITSVSQAAQETGHSALQVLETAKELGTQSNKLQKQISDFLSD
jgi:methyl-accepting chemotaxis protein